MQSAQIILSTTHLTNKLFATVRNCHISSWIFIGYDAWKIKNIAQQLPPECKKINIASTLNSTQYAIREEFIRFSDQLEASRPFPFWWASSIAVKNPWLSRFFLKTSQIIAAEHICSNEVSHGRRILVIFEDQFVQNSFYQKIRTKYRCHSFGLKIQPLFIFPLYIIQGLFKRAGIFCKLWVQLIRGWSLRRFFKSHFRSISGPSLLMPTFIDSRSFQNGCYKDAFIYNVFFRLKESFRGTIIVYPILIDQPRKMIGPFLKWAVQNGCIPFFHTFSLPFHLQIKAFFRAFLQKPGSKNQPIFHHFRLNGLLRCERYEEWRSFYFFQQYLFDEAARYLSSRISSHLHFVYPFENQAWERIFLYRISQRQGTSIAFQNAPSPQLSLRYFAVIDATLTIPLPHILLTNGPVSFNALNPWYASLMRVIQCSSSRPRHSSHSIRPSKSDNSTQFLCIGSVGVMETREMIFRIIEAFSMNPPGHFRILFHPLAPQKTCEAYGDFHFPPFLQTADKSFSECMQEADIIFFNSSTAGIQALEMEIPAIFIGHECNVHVDPTEFDSQYIRRAYTSKELISAVSYFLSHKMSFEKSYRAATQYFGGPSSSSASSLIPELLQTTR